MLFCVLPMSEPEFDASVGRLLREYGDTKKQLNELVESIRALSKSISAVGFGMTTLNDGSFTDEGKATKALAELPAELNPDFLRGLMAQCKQLRGRYLDLISQLKPYGVE